MQKVLEGIKRMLFERPALTILLIAAILFGYRSVVRNGEADVWGIAMAAAGTYSILWIFWNHERKKAVAGPSETVVTDRDDLLHIRITETVCGKMQPHPSNLGLSNREPGNLERMTVVFENHTGAPIQTDTSYAIERQIRSKWYRVETDTAFADKQPLALPEGVSAPVSFAPKEVYGVLAPGEYRLVKTMDTAAGAITAAAAFTIREGF